MSGLFDALIQSFQFPFMQNAYLTALLISPAAAMLSCFLVLKGWALLGDAASHATMPGVVIAYIIGAPYALGGFVAAMFCVLSVGFLAANSRIKADTAMGIVFSGMFGLGIVIHAWTGSGLHLDHVLFGNMLGIHRDELLVSGAIAVAITLTLAIKWRDFLLYIFDPIQARACGLHVGWLHNGLLMMVAAVIVAMLASIGLILAIGLLIAPGAIAFLLVRRFSAMMAVAVAVCLTATLGGVNLSFYLDSAPAPTIVLILTAMFLAAFACRAMVTRRASRISRA